MSAVYTCRENHQPVVHKKTLEEFVVVPGETLEESLSRAITWHIDEHTFSDIARVISKKRLEIAIYEMSLDDQQQMLMYELLGQAAFPAQGIAARLISACTRTALRNKLARLMTPHQMLIIRAYEHHLEQGTMRWPTKPSDSVFGVGH